MVSWRNISILDELENKKRSAWLRYLCEESGFIYHGMREDLIEPLLNLFPTTYAKKIGKLPSPFSGKIIQNVCSKNQDGYKINFCDLINRDPEDQSLTVSLSPLIISSVGVNFPYIRIDRKQNRLWGYLLLLIVVAFTLVISSIAVIAAFIFPGWALGAALFMAAVMGILYYNQIWLPKKFKISNRELAFPEEDTFGKRFSVHCEKGKEEMARQLLTVEFREYFTNTFASWRGGGIELNQNVMLLPHAPIDNDADFKLLKVML